MPDARPLMPIAHWRNGNPAMLTVRMLKAQSLRQRYRVPIAHQPNRRLTGFEAPDPLDRRPFW